MKMFIYLIAATLALLGCNNSTVSHDGQKVEQSTTDTNTKTGENHLQSSIQPGNIFTLADAETIMGEPAHLTDSASKIKGADVSFIDSMSSFKKDAAVYSCSYTANAKDKKTGKTGIIYFVLEQYPEVSSAEKVYSFYKNANGNAIGFKALHDIGDEAWFGSSPLFVQARKGNKIFVLKVNKMTSMTSSDAFNLVVKKVADAL